MFGRNMQLVDALRKIEQMRREYYVSEQGNNHLIGPNPIRQPGEWEPYKGSHAPATS